MRKFSSFFAFTVESGLLYQDAVQFFNFDVEEKRYDDGEREEKEIITENSKGKRENFFFLSLSSLLDLRYAAQFWDFDIQGREKKMMMERDKKKRDRKTEFDRKPKKNKLSSVFYLFI